MQQGPVIFKWDENITVFTQFYLPAITICPEINVDDLKSTNISNGEGFLQTCNYSDFKYSSVNSANYAKTLRKMAVPFEEIFLKCYTSSNFSFSCSDVFSEVITDIGICYTFNMLDAKDLYKQDVVKDKQNKSINFNWNFSNDTFFIVFELQLNAHDYKYFCRESSDEFTIWLHSPYETSSKWNQSIQLSLNHDIKLFVNPQMTTTSKSLIDFTPERFVNIFIINLLKYYFSFHADCSASLMTKGKYL